MKGRISIAEFIHKVKDELVRAQNRDGDPFYELSEVTLEVSFVLDASAKAGVDLYVLELGGETKAQQSHKVTLRLTPLTQLAQSNADAVAAKSSDQAPTQTEGPAKQVTVAQGTGGGGGGGSGGRGLFGRGGPVYDKVGDNA